MTEHNNFDVITVGENETDEIRVGDEETFENTILDITADGSVARVIIEGENATVRNVGWRGAQDSKSYAVMAITGSGAMTVDNVYMGDGSTTGASAGNRDPTAIWASPKAKGSILFRNVNVQSWGDNGFYLSSASALTPTIDKCYAADNPNADIRVGSEGSVIRRSVVRNARARGIWAWGPATASVEECHIHAPGESAFWAGEASNGGATINVEDTQYEGDISEPYGTVNFTGESGSSPEDFHPDGLPTSAEEAATGGGKKKENSDGGVEVTLTEDGITGITINGTIEWTAGN